ncbi:MAG TPA: 50S ribosomal protein L29 [Phycisphaerae bacterium]|nr:50S ribosomal protein L29 [Phycisphaerae bacterium]
MKVTEIREMKSEELYSELDRLRRYAFDLRSQAVTEKLQDPSLLTRAKRDIARIFTVLRERGERGIEQKQYHLEALATHKRAK